MFWVFWGCYEVIANLLTALLQRSSRRYVGRHRLPEGLALSEDGDEADRPDGGVEIVMNDGTRTSLRPPTASV